MTRMCNVLRTLPKPHNSSPHPAGGTGAGLCFAVTLVLVRIFYSSLAPLSFSTSLRRHPRSYSALFALDNQVFFYTDILEAISEGFCL